MFVYINFYLFNHKSIASLSAAVGAVAGGISGDSAASAQLAGVIAKNAVENNQMLTPDNIITSIYGNDEWGQAAVTGAQKLIEDGATEEVGHYLANYTSGDYNPCPDCTAIYTLPSVVFAGAYTLGTLGAAETSDAVISASTSVINYLNSAITSVADTLIDYASSTGGQMALKGGTISSAVDAELQLSANIKNGTRNFNLTENALSFGTGGYSSITTLSKAVLANFGSGFVLSYSNGNDLSTSLLHGETNATGYIGGSLFGEGLSALYSGVYKNKSVIFDYAKEAITSYNSSKITTELNSKGN